MGNGKNSSIGKSNNLIERNTKYEEFETVSNQVETDWDNRYSDEFEEQYYENMPSISSDVLNILKKWKGSYFTDIRKASIGENKQFEDDANLLEKFISDYNTYENPIFRGISVPNNSDLLKQLTEGNTLNQKGISSWSTDINSTYNKSFANVESANKESTSIVFVSMRGTNQGRDISSGNSEQEIIMSSKATQWVDRVIKTKNSHGRHIYFVYVSDT